MTNLGYDDSQKAAKLFNHWALTLSYDGRQLDAERIYRQALAISRDDDTNNAVAPVLLVNYAWLLRELGRTAEASRYLNMAAIRARELNDNILTDDIDLLRSLMFIDAHELEQASGLLAELEQRLSKRYAPQHYVFAELASARSLIALRQGDIHTADDYARQAIELDEASIRRIGQCAAYLPTLLVRKSEIEHLGRHEDVAASDAKRAIDLLKDEEGAGIPSSNIGRAYLALARALQGAGKQDEAQLASRKAYANLQTTLGLDHPDTRTARQLADSRLPSH
jgi:tetratricopeptide (TPR) repeat protein